MRILFLMILLLLGQAEGVDDNSAANNLDITESSTEISVKFKMKKPSTEEWTNDWQAKHPLLINSIRQDLTPFLLCPFYWRPVVSIIGNSFKEDFLFSINNINNTREYAYLHIIVPQEENFDLKKYLSFNEIHARLTGATGLHENAAKTILDENLAEQFYTDCKNSTQDIMARICLVIFEDRSYHFCVASSSENECKKTCNVLENMIFTTSIVQTEKDSIIWQKAL